MKSKHLAKADYLRELTKLANELYELGDFTSDDPKRTSLSAKIQGFADAGTLIEVVTPADIQKIIDKAHLGRFGEDRASRRLRILEERSKSEGKKLGQDEPDWDRYDSPPKNRKR